MRTRKYSSAFILFLFLFHIILVATAGAVNTIMPLGDSITWDDRSNDTRGDGEKIAYRYRLWQLLTNAGYEIDFVGSQSTGFDIFPDSENEGHPGWTDDEIVNGNPAEPGANNLAVWLNNYQPAIVLLHIGTNDLDPSPDDVEAILDEIDAFSPSVWVVMARIINRNCIFDVPTPCPQAQITTDFNDNIEVMAQDRIDFGGDKIIIVDMELGAGIDYHLTTDNPPGDMWDNLHPFETGVDSGYSKMADLWFTGLVQILPQADAGDPQTVKETVTVTLDGSNSSDPDGTIASYLWEQVTGTPVTLPGVLPSPTATFTAPDVAAAGETLTFKLTVTDNDGLESTDTVSIDVINTTNPVANAGDDQNVTEGDTVTLDGSNSRDPDGTIVSYLWEEVTATGVTINNDTTTPTATFTAPDIAVAGATLSFRLTVTDDDGLASNDTMNVNVAEPLLAVGGDNQNVTIGDTVTLDGTGSTGPIASYEWIQTAGTPVQLSGDDTPTPTFTAPDASAVSAALFDTLTFQLTVSDNVGATSIDTTNVNVDDGIAPDTGGGGGGGGGCFIATMVDGSPMALHDKVPRELRSRFAMVNWKRRMSGNIRLPTPRAEHAATPALVATMVVLISSCAAITLRKPRKRWLKL